MSTGTSRHDELREEYGTLNPDGKLLTSDALDEELDEILDSSRAKVAESKCAHGSDHTVTVELTFHVDDFPEVFDDAE
ncbi:hypothetical protein C453_12751 [Haloferax elongans ATCC BAA-1513]|uniref:Uncharacterized protein n=1 Tax=Haloferax elongans ATCC BAA-1513 TaxID=1230453 RepID=M0HIN7_HALEO|nr:hypothetical protein [Haloferax elongans]ELZ84415.1 hypothetical protein C453_12751 [Haloferax elongans ATCC BAA-1513]